LPIGAARERDNEISQSGTAAGIDTIGRLHDPYIPTAPDLVRAKLEFGEVTSEDTVFDLGCGDGRVLVMAALEFGAAGVGVDLQMGVVEEAWSNIADHELEDKVAIHCQDFMDTDLAGADLVILYLTGRTLHALSDKLQEMKSGARIVTHDFPLPGWSHCEQGEFTSQSGQSHSLFLYRKR
jgi:SAM-dependent methyltransferase